jgi:glutaredoxin-like protein NrdH
MSLGLFFIWGPKKEVTMTITVLSKPNCVQCTATKRALDNKGISYETIDITEDLDALSRAKELGYRSAPVVIAGEDHWSGFQVDKIEALAGRLAAA